MLAAIAGCLIAAGAYVLNPFVTWREEVKLNDGRVIVVEQKKLTKDEMAREAWLTINLPEFSAESIVWHEHLSPMVLNIEGGILYVVGRPPTSREERQYGCPAPPYVGFAWDGHKWNQIPFAKIPEKIYSANMLIDHLPPSGTRFLKLGTKNGDDLNGRGTLPPSYKRVDPTIGNRGCVQ